MTPELQRAQDMLAAMQAQRDNALNAMVHAQAEIAWRDRKIAALEKQAAAVDEASAARAACIADEDRRRSQVIPLGASDQEEAA